MELPAYRFYNMVMMRLKEDRTPEAMTKFENSLRTLDSMGHPWLSSVGDFVVVPNTSQPSPTTKVRPRKSALSEDEQVALEGLTKPAVGKKLVPREMPDWYRGEDANYKIAKNVMGQANSLPKSQ